MSGDMTTAQLLAWADKCLKLARDSADGKVWTYTDNARQDVADAMRELEEP